MKIKRILMIAVNVLAVGMIVLSGVMKLAGVEAIVKSLETAGVGQFRLELALAEIIFAALYAIPQTTRIGFLLLASYFAGALATELSHGLPLSALTPLLLIWLAAYLREPAIFHFTGANHKSARTRSFG